MVIERGTRGGGVLSVFLSQSLIADRASARLAGSNWAKVEIYPAAVWLQAFAAAAEFIWLS